MKNKHVIFRAIEYFINNPDTTPTLAELRLKLNVSGNEATILANMISLNYPDSNTNHILYSSYGFTSDALDNKPLQILPSAIVTYNEYLEIEMARLNSQQAVAQSNKAHSLALTAFWVSLVVGIIQIGISVIW